MEDFGSLWSYQESVDDLKQNLLYTTLELETVKMEANEALKKHKEEAKNLLNLLKIAYQERDESKAQLQKLLNKLMPSSPLLVPTKANSSITESNSLSETYKNPQSHISSHVDSFYMDGFVNQPFVQDINCGTAVIDSIAKGKALPQKGKLLQAVMEAAPTLQTLLVAGPLPHWRNPPPLQAFKASQFSINQKAAANSSFVAHKSLSSSSYVHMSRMSSQMCSTSMLNFSTSGDGISTQIPSGKRQRFQ